MKTQKSLSSSRRLLAVALGLSGGLLALSAGCFTVPTDGGNGNENDNDSQTGNSGVTGKYIGADACAQCHAETHADWLSTLHVSALESLEGSDHAEDFCLACHTVGYGEEGGFVNRSTTNVLAGVQCENCHGPARDHVDNPGDESVRPTMDIGADVCGACHTGEHQPTFEQWSEARHSQIDEHVADYFTQGIFLNTCGVCHSGDFYHLSVLEGETVEDALLAGFAPEAMQPITCVICHDPHARTGNAAAPDEGRDFQLRFRQSVSPTPSYSIADATNPQRFNLCGQCHHSRGRTWTATSRGPHHSIQANIYAGEMPIDDPETQEPLVLSRVSVHSFSVEQCSTCHMYREDFQSELAPAISGHLFSVDFKSCAAAGCHPSEESAIAVNATLRSEIQARADDILERLGNPDEWQYTAADGPDEEGQAAIPDEIKQVRFLYEYVVNDGSLGVHNPAYVRSILEKADEILTAVGR